MFSFRRAILTQQRQAVRLDKERMVLHTEAYFRGRAWWPVYDLVWGRTAERIRTKESTGILCQGKALLESTLWLERFPQEVLFRLKAILQGNGTRVPSPLAREGRGKGRGVKQMAFNPLTPAHISVWIAEMDVLYVHPKGEGHGWHGRRQLLARGA